MEYINNWEEIKQRFIDWWKGENTGRPMMRVVARRNEPIEPLEPVSQPSTPEEKHLDVDRKVKQLRNFCRKHVMLAEAYPSLDINIGPGSMATYLGAEPVFTEDTVWYKECIKDGWENFGPLKYDPENYWWKRHQELIRKAKEIAGDSFLVNIPDIIENLDILSAMRGAQDMCFDLIDQPELVKCYIDQVDELYFKYYDPIYEIVKDKDGGSSYTIFQIWGPGKTAKIQCDFSALMSPAQFREFIVPSLKKQCQRLDYTLYHLDGPDAIKHVDALMEIEELDALQWTAGAGQPDGGSEKWYPIYDKVRDAGKSLWIILDSKNTLEDCIVKTEKLVKRYGTKGIYILYPTLQEEEARILLNKVERGWA